MRIITGTAKGRRLFPPKSNLIRPAADKVKGAIFNMLGSVEDLLVLDLFAGTGNIGVEAASRGAARVVLVDFLPEALALCKKNTALLPNPEVITIFKGHIPKCLKAVARMIPRFDLVFVDPPYDKNLVGPSLAAVLGNNLVDAQSTVIIEHSPREKAQCEGLTVTDERTYGQTLITVMQKT